MSEASLARTNETNLQSAVNSEITRATAAEATISTKVSSLETKLDSKMYVDGIFIRLPNHINPMLAKRQNTKGWC